jgi:hypothetical protein
MKWLLLVLGVVAIVLLMAFLKARQRRPAEREFKSTDEFVQWLASEAVNDAAQNNHINLDYTPASIKDAEKILGKLHDAYVQRPSSVSVKGLAAAYGAYIGEVIRRTEPNVRWERDDPVFGEKVYPLHWDKGTVYPMGWCQKRIVDGDGDNVWIKYTILKEKRSEN